MLIADQREARRFPRAFLSFTHRRIAPLPSALFVELFAPVPVGVLNFNGCCHLGTELNRLRFRKLTFLALHAVARTRRFAINQTRFDYAAAFFSSRCLSAFRNGS